MTDIYHFKIHQADAQVVDGGNLRVRLFYPKKPKYIEKRLEENLVFGVEVFERLVSEGYSPIASTEVPMNSPAAGSAYLLSDNVLVCHRRDKFAPTHKLMHGIPSGYAQSREDLYSPEGIVCNGLRETAEECLLITRETPPRIIVPKCTSKITLEVARMMGISLDSISVTPEVLEPSDTLEVYHENGDTLFTMKTNINFMYESQTTINAIQIYKLPFSSEEVYPMDAEGKMKGSQFIHFNRESYFISLEKVANKPFGSVLDSPEIYQTKIVDGVPETYTPCYEPPYLGPYGYEVKSPHIWAPNNLLTRVLDELHVPGYHRSWKELELQKEKSFLSGRPIIPKELLI